MKNLKLRKVFFAACIVVAVVAAAYLGWYGVGVWQHYREAAAIKELQPSGAPPSAPPVDTGDSPQPSGPGASGGDIASPPPTERDLLAAAETLGRERFAELLEVNPDFWGTLTIPGLKDVDNLPYVWYSDNEKYLTTSFQGKNSTYGTVFMDTYNDPYLTDHNNVFYGHHMNDGSMFAKITQYSDIAAYKNAPYIDIDSLTGSTRWLIFAAYTCEPDYGYINTAVSGADFAELLIEMQERSYWHSDVDVNENDRIITLSTCAYTFEDARFVIHARRLRSGEQLPESFNAVRNPKPKPPVIPKQMKVSAINANQIGAALTPSLRLLFFQRTKEGIEWYVGSTTTVQGPYALSPEVTKFYDHFSWLGALVQPDGKRFYLAASGLDRALGVSVMTTYRVGGTFRSRKIVTPPGIDARYPLFACDPEENVWLCYTVKTASGTDVYKMKLEGGTPELILSTEKDPRPVFLTWRNNTETFIWQDAATGEVFTNGGAKLSIAGAAGDRLTFYNEPTAEGKWKLMTERKGKLTFTLYDPGEIYAAAPPTGEPDTVETPTSIATETSLEP
ncbi:hypothetical protein FACS1894202_12440 [Clostridia bacterium]|nr:hypothetical protein FACS1894202_12440 [Clostridia bacterium]